MDFYDMAESVDKVLHHLQLKKDDPEVGDEVSDLIRELSTIEDVLFVLHPFPFTTVEDRKRVVRQLWARANNERGRCE